MINLMVAHDTIMVSGARNCIVIEGRFRRGRDFDIADIAETREKEYDFKEINIAEGTYEVLQSCSHIDGYTTEKVYHMGDKLVFTSEVDECFLRHSGTSTYIDAVYSINNKEFYIPSDSEESQIESQIESI